MTLYGPCAAGSLCRAFDKVSGQPEDTDGHSLGPACLRAGVFAVNALPADWRDLEQVLPRPLGQWGDGQPRGSDGPPVPINLSVEALQRAIWWTVTAWEEVVREFDRLSDPPLRVREGPSVVRACAVLSPRLDRLADVAAVELMTYPLADEEESLRWMGVTHTPRLGWQGVLDLVRLHSRASATLGLTSPVRRLPGLCSACGRDELRQDQPEFKGDEQMVYCGNCALTMTYDEWRRAMGMWEAA